MAGDVPHHIRFLFNFLIIGEKNMKTIEKNVRLVSVNSDGAEYRKENGLLCVIHVSVEAERPANFDLLPLKVRARYAHAKGQNVAKYFFINEFIAEMQFLDENDTANEFTTEQHNSLKAAIKKLSEINESSNDNDNKTAGAIIEKYLQAFSCVNGMLPIYLTTAPISEVLRGTQFEGVKSVIVESNGNEVTLNEVTNFNFIPNDDDAELSYLRNSLLQQIANNDAIPVTQQPTETGKKSDASTETKSEVFDF